MQQSLPNSCVLDLPHMAELWRYEVEVTCALLILINITNILLHVHEMCISFCFTFMAWILN